ncbi:hypothetical protein C4569_00395 [Candidatus Parcubacteria bacterium]|nr:MAG: hypothetical protein C4569_00395 [Candidatus Parcubacteria bacterium]
MLGTNLDTPNPDWRAIEVIFKEPKSFAYALVDFFPYTDPSLAFIVNNLMGLTLAYLYKVDPHGTYGIIKLACERIRKGNDTVTTKDMVTKLVEQMSVIPGQDGLVRKIINLLDDAREKIIESDREKKPGLAIKVA